MPDFRVISTNTAAPPRAPYSQAIATPTTIYCSGQIPMTPSGNILSLETSSIGEMTEQCLKNLSQILSAAGSSMDKIVKVNVFITTMDHFPELNEVYAKMLPHKPARSCVAVSQLPLGALVEIECIALA